MRTLNRTIIAALVVALAQIGFLGWIIAGRAAVLRDGREIVLKIEPIDPNDLLRGDYVSLFYEISRISVSDLTNVPTEEYLAADRTLYVRLKKGSDGYWHQASATFDAPLSSAPGPEEADIKGAVGRGSDLGKGASLYPDYGIERFYLPEGEGMDIQQDMRRRAFGIRIAVASDGTAQIKALLDGDKQLYEEPLY
jgi:uncharacterized membrane-anchored protein